MLQAELSPRVRAKENAAPAAPPASSSGGTPRTELAFEGSPSPKEVYKRSFESPSPLKMTTSTPLGGSGVSSPLGRTRSSPHRHDDANGRSVLHEHKVPILLKDPCC